MTAVDAPTHQQPTAAPAPTEGPAPAGGRHRWDKGGPVDHVGRRLITHPVPATWWPPSVPRHRDTPTVLMPPVPDNREQVLAEMRAELHTTRTEETTTA